MHILSKCNSVTNVRVKLNSGQSKEFNSWVHCVFVTWTINLQVSTWHGT